MNRKDNRDAELERIAESVHEKEEKDDKTSFEGVVKEYLELKSGEDYQNAKEIVKERNVLRLQIRELALQNEELPENSEYFIGIAGGRIYHGEVLKFSGRVSYKGLSEELARLVGLSDLEFERKKDEHRGDARKVVVGLRKELNEKTMMQLEFDFITPSYNAGST